MNNLKNELILWYLNYDNIKLTEKEIYEQSQIYNIPFQIFLKKLIERLFTENKANSKSIIDILIDKMNLNLSIDALKYVKNLVNLVKPITIKSRSDISVIDINKKLNLFNKLESVTDVKPTHKDQPLPDSDNGRPCIGWRECYYEGCHKTFSYEHELINHLQNLNAYIPSFHKIHEEIVLQNNLTEDKIIANNITKCPAYICNYDNINSAEEVIEHFQKLGIPPFWKKNMIITSKTKTTDYIFNKEIKIFNIDECIICLQNKPNIILDKCLHCCFCIDCFLSLASPPSSTSWNIKICPICRSIYSKVYPY